MGGLRRVFAGSLPSKSLPTGYPDHARQFHRKSARAQVQTPVIPQSPRHQLFIFLPSAHLEQEFYQSLNKIAARLSAMDDNFIL